MRAGVASILFGALAVLLTVSAVVSAVLTLHMLQAQRASLLRQAAWQNSAYFSDRILKQCADRNCDWSAVIGTPNLADVLLMTRDFRVVFGKSLPWLARHPAMQDVFQSRQNQMVEHQKEDQSHFAALRSLRLQSGEDILLAVIQRSKTIRTAEDQRLLLTVLGLNLLLILIFGAYLVHRSVVKPIASLEGWVNRRRKDLDSAPAIDIPGPKEVSRLHDAFVALLVALEKKSANLETSREKLALTQQQLAHRDRLVTVGRVASGIAHEVGNPLSSVIGFLSLLRAPKDLDLMGLSGADVMQRMDDELERIRKAIRSLLDLSQPVTVVPKIVDLSEVISDVVTIVNVRTKKTTVHLDLGPKQLRTIYFDPDLLLQVLSNLCLNAVEAMDGEGEIHLQLCAFADNAVRLTLSDTGPGIAPEIADVIFEEFQTTKRDQGGTGLGLSISRSLMTLGGGTLGLVSPQPAVGAAFWLNLPIHRQD